MPHDKVMYWGVVVLHTCIVGILWQQNDQINAMVITKNAVNIDRESKDGKICIVWLYS